MGYVATNFHELRSDFVASDTRDGNNVELNLRQVKFLQGIQIHDDEGCASQTTPCIVQSSCLNEELG